MEVQVYQCARQPSWKVHTWIRFATCAQGTAARITMLIKSVLLYYCNLLNYLVVLYIHVQHTGYMVERSRVTHLGIAGYCQVKEPTMTQVKEPTMTQVGHGNTVQAQGEHPMSNICIMESWEPGGTWFWHHHLVSHNHRNHGNLVAWVLLKPCSTSYLGPYFKLSRGFVLSLLVFVRDRSKMQWFNEVYGWIVAQWIYCMQQRNNI